MGKDEYIKLIEEKYPAIDFENTLEDKLKYDNLRLRWNGKFYKLVEK